MMRHQIDGLIVIGGRTGSQNLEQLTARIPLIIVGRNLVGNEERSLWIGNLQAASNAVLYLIELGHGPIAHVNGIADFKMALIEKEHFLRYLKMPEPIQEQTIEGDFRRRSGLLAVETLLSRGTSLSAILAANDQLAFAARLALFRRGIHVLDDV